MPLLFDQFEVRAFRGLRNLKLEKLGRVNLLVGLNDSGKTSVLEAVALMARPFDPMWWLRLSHQREPTNNVPFRRLPRTERIRWLFPPDSPSQPGPPELVIKAEGRSPITDLAATFTRVVEMRPEYRILERAHAPERESVGAKLQIAFSSAGQAHTRSFTLWQNEPVRPLREEFAGPHCEIVLAYNHWMPTVPLRGYSQARLGGPVRS